MERIYYVYEWYFVDTEKVFYVGKGKGRRYRERKDRSDIFRNYVQKFECKSRKVVESLTEEEAYKEEIRIISLYRKQGIKLINKTDGGDDPPRFYGLEHKYHRRVVQLTLDGEYVQTWDCILNVEKSLGINNSLICRCCQGKTAGSSNSKTKYPSAGGFLWVYTDKYDPNINYKYKPGTVARAIIQYALDGSFIREWESAKQAANELRLHRGPLCSCLKGNYHTCGGYIWRYKESC